MYKFIEVANKLSERHLLEVMLQKWDLADESADLPRGQTVIHARKDGYGDDDVAEDASHVVKRVYGNW